MSRVETVAELVASRRPGMTKDSPLVLAMAERAVELSEIDPAVAIAEVLLGVAAEEPGSGEEEDVIDPGDDALDTSEQAEGEALTDRDDLA